MPLVIPYRRDPYRLFAGYPSRHLQFEVVVALEPGMDWPAAHARLGGPLANYSGFNRPTAREQALVINHLAANGPAPVFTLLDLVAKDRRNYMERCLIWMARHDMVAIKPAA
jgi:hypothetical protein